MPRQQTYYTDAHILKALESVRANGTEEREWLLICIDAYIESQSFREAINPLVKKLIAEHRKEAREREGRIVMLGPAMAFEIIMAIYLHNGRYRERIEQIIRKGETLCQSV